MTKRKRSGSGVAPAIGGMLAGFDHQIFRTTPPPHELVLKASPVRGLSGEDGDLVITIPADEAVILPPDGDGEAADSGPPVDGE